MEIATFLDNMNMPCAGMRPKGTDVVRLEHQHPSKGFLSGALFSAGGMVIGGFLTVAAATAFARWLGPEGFGVYSLTLVTLALVGGIGTLGLDNSIGRFSAYYLGSGENRRIQGLFSYGILRILLFSSTLGLGLLAAFRLRLFDHTRLVPLASHSLVLAVAIPLYAVQLTFLQGVLGLQGVRARVLLEKVIQPMCRLAVPFLLVLWIGKPISAAVAGLVVSALLVDVASGIFLRRKVVSFPTSSSIESSEKKEWLNYALPFVFSSLQSFVSSGLGLDVFLVGALLSVHAAGIYAAAFRLTPALWLARGAMDYNFGPRAGVLFGQSDLNTIGTMYRSTSSIALAWTLPIALLLAVFGKPVMGTLFGSAYEAGGTALSLLVLGFVIDSATGCNTTLLAMVGRSGLVLLNGALGGVALLSLCVVLIPRWGTAGAALATVTSITITNSMATIEIWKLYRLLPFSWITLKLFAAGIAVAMFMTYWRASILPMIWPGLLGLAASAGVALLAYFGLVLAITPDLRGLYPSSVD
jgi:O-antigen/teichoic acid export membrane protein